MNSSVKGEASKLRSLIAPICLAVIALNQVSRAINSDLNSWKGGGFGMFATLDQWRFAKIYQRSATANLPIPTPREPDMRQQFETALMLPTEDRVQSLAADLDARRTVPEDQDIVVATFSVSHELSTPPRVVATSEKMVSSKPHLTQGKLKWRW